MKKQSIIAITAVLTTLFSPIVAQKLDGQNYRGPQSAVFSLEPALNELLQAEELERATRLGGGLADMLHGFLLDNEVSNDLAGHKLAHGGRFGDFYSVSKNKAVVDFTVKGDLESCLDGFRNITGIELLASASAPNYHVISALVPVDKLLEAMDLTGIICARAGISRAGGSGLMKGSDVRSQGVADNQAEAALEVEAVRRVFSTADGSGIQVGTLSDSVNQVGTGISASQGTGDLPANAKINVINDWNGASTDEGRAMMEHIYDIAPGLDMMGYATAFGGVATFAANITALANAGMDIINDDVVNLTEPYYQDGVIAQAVNSFVNSGGIYFALNHNYANLSYEKVFTDGDANNWHEYSAGDELATLTVAAGTVASPTRITIGLQWAQPWAGATTDLDLQVYSTNPVTLLFSSNVNNIGANPQESLSFTNTGAQQSLRIAVRRVSGSIANLTFKYILYANGAWQGSIPDYPNDAAGTLTPHAGTPLSIAIGAAPYFNRNVAETFSGNGPHRRFFGSAGNAVGPFTLTKPDFMAVDKCNTTFFGRDITQDADVLPNFSGTSAATPNAAAVAALMLEMAGGPGSLNATNIKESMRVSAIDLGDAGHDTTYGHGRINALGAVMACMGPRSIENTAYLNQYGDTTERYNLGNITDIDTFEYASNSPGATTIDLYEIHAQMDPMMVLFNQLGNLLIDLDYDSGPGDDARFSFQASGLFPYIIEVVSEEDFTTTANYDLIIDGPTQYQINRTAFLDPNGEDAGFSGSLSTIGDSEYVVYTAPTFGNMHIGVEPTGFHAYLRVYDQQGDLVKTGLVADGLSGGMDVDFVVAGATYAIQVVSPGYVSAGSFNFSASFTGVSSDFFRLWRRQDSFLCSTQAPSILNFLNYLDNLGCAD